MSSSSIKEIGIEAEFIEVKLRDENCLICRYCTLDQTNQLKDIKNVYPIVVSAGEETTSETPLNLS